LHQAGPGYCLPESARGVGSKEIAMPQAWNRWRGHVTLLGGGLCLVGTVVLTVVTYP
jgi:hypothetical protein